MKRIKNTMAGLPFAVLILAISGCATTRGILDVRSDTGVNPASGQAVKITSVTDSRKFEISPGSASIPSLKGDEIANKAITSRAIARKRNSYGKALGDILLPEGRTVNMLVSDAVTRAFRESGYRVLTRSDPGYDSAKPVGVDIQQFWAWMTPGFWAISLEFETRLKIGGDNRASGKTVRGYIRKKSGAAGSGTWMETVNAGIEDLVTNLKKEL